MFSDIYRHDSGQICKNLRVHDEFSDLQTIVGFAGIYGLTGTHGFMQHMLNAQQIGMKCWPVDFCFLHGRAIKHLEPNSDCSTGLLSLQNTQQHDIIPPTLMCWLRLPVCSSNIYIMVALTTRPTKLRDRCMGVHIREYSQ